MVIWKTNKQNDQDTHREGPGPNFQDQHFAMEDYERSAISYRWEPLFKDCHCERKCGCNRINLWHFSIWALCVHEQDKTTEKWCSAGRHAEKIRVGILAASPIKCQLLCPEWAEGQWQRSSIQLCHNKPFQQWLPFARCFSLLISNPALRNVGIMWFCKGSQKF